MNTRTDGLIEFKGHLINPNIVIGSMTGAVVWSEERINIVGGIDVANRVSAQIMKEWSDEQRKSQERS